MCVFQKEQPKSQEFSYFQFWRSSSKFRLLSNALVLIQHGQKLVIANDIIQLDLPQLFLFKRTTCKKLRRCKYRSNTLSSFEGLLIAGMVFLWKRVCATDLITTRDTSERMQRQMTAKREVYNLCQTFGTAIFYKTTTVYGGFLRWWYPTTMGFPTKNDHFGVFWGTTIFGNIHIRDFAQSL